MMFVIVMDTLNRLFVKAQHDEVLQPIGVPAIKHHCSLYADDEILLLSPSVDKARAIKFILQLFGDASGLVTSVDKCSITPIYGDQVAIQAFHAVLPCQVLEFLFKYLGVPLSTMALPKSQYRPLIDKIGAKLPAWQGKLLNRSGRLVLVKSTLSALPIYLMMSDKLPSWVIHEIDSLRRNFLWSGKDHAVRGKNMVAWPTVYAPTNCGGLGIIDIRLSGFALHVRWLWMQRADDDRAWSAMPIKVEPEVQALFDASVTAAVGNGSRTLFWLDNWIGGQSVRMVAPYLHRFIPSRITKRRTVAEALIQKQWIRDIQGGFSVPAIRDYVRLWHILAEISLNDEPDCFRWKWTASGTYTASSAYMAMFIGTVRTPAIHWVWKSWAPLRVKFFAWLALKQRLWTADRRRRHNLDAHDTCWLCDQEAETVDHMLISCSFAKVIWWNILSWMDCACSFQGQPLIHTAWEYLRGLQTRERKHGFDSLFMCIIWVIWKERNNRLFEETSCTTAELQDKIKLDVKLWILAGARRLGCLKRE